MLSTANLEAPGSKWPCLPKHRMRVYSAPVQSNVLTSDSAPGITSETGRSLSDQVHEYLVERIVRGEISYGEKLNIKQLAVRLGVSPMPIRDAIKRLEQEGVVVVYPRSHCYVRTPTKRAVLEAIEARRMVEISAARSLYEYSRLPPAQRLNEILEAMRPLVVNGDGEERNESTERYIELDRQFHTTLVGLAGNRYLDSFYRQISLHLNMSFSYGIGVCHGVAATFAEHETIVERLVSGSEEFVHLLERHLLRSRENIVKEPTYCRLPD